MLSGFLPIRSALVWYQKIEWNGDADGGECEFLLGAGKWEGIKGGGIYSIIQRAKSILTHL